MRILPVIVLYNQNLFESKSYISLLKDSDLNFVVYDNSPVQMHDPLVFGDKIKYISDKGNGGVSGAYNYAAAFAKKNDFNWLLLLDQDTIFPEESLERYILACRQNPDIMLFAPVLKLSDGRLLSPVKSFLRHSYAVKLTGGKRYPLSKIVPVNSGILINTGAFLSAWGYDEKVFLDLADFEFAERFSKLSDSFFLIDIECVQDFSDIDSDMERLLKRFEIFCSCAGNYKKNGLFDSFCFGSVLVRRALGLTIRTGSPVFFKKVFSHYFSSNSF